MKLLFNIMKSSSKSLLREAIKSILLQEKLNSNKQAIQRTLVTLKEAIQAAQKYVDSIVAQKRDASAAKDLKVTTEKLKQIISWLNKHQAGWVPETKLAYQAISAIANKSGFWNTPKFLNVSDHSSEMKDLLEQAKALTRKAFMSAKRFA